MSERILFLTGRLARPRLERTLSELRPDFAWRVADVGVKVAALMTEAIVTRRMKPDPTANRIVIPGRARADLDRLAAHFGVPVARGPDEISDLPRWLGLGGRAPDLSRHDCLIFAEIVEAAELAPEAILERARDLARRGADVIDLGCLPDTPFPHLEDAVAALKGAGLKVSVDSAEREELARAARAGADYLLSLTEETLDLVDEGSATPVLISREHGDLESLIRAGDALTKRGRRFLADPILDPIHFGFAASLMRYAELRRRRPDFPILMGTGNLTELTDADTGGATAMLMGVVSELNIEAVLTVQVSPHTRRTIEEHDAARRMMFAAREDGAAPRDYSQALLSLHDRRPFPNSAQEIAEMAAAVSDRNFRVETAADGIHVYNRDRHEIATDAMSLFPKLGVEADGPHAFYLGTELMKAEIAWTLGKRYAQDEPLDWGVAADAPDDDRTRLAEAGHTLRAGRAREKG